MLAGDLNSRIALPDGVVRECLAKGDLPRLLAADQLTLRRDTDAVWRGWREAVVRFLPTYKYTRCSADTRLS